MRIGIKFERTGMSKFVSHLDMQRVFSRAIRRSGIRAVYSQGFNPHIILSFAQALAVGLETTGDYMEFSAQEGEENIASKLSRVMPPDVKIAAVGRLEDKGKKLMAAVESAEYDIYFGAGVAEKLRAFMAMESYMLQNKKGTELDARSLVFDAEIEEDHAKLVLSLSSKASLSPFTLMEYLAPGKNIRIVRRELFTNIDGEAKPLSALFVENILN